MNKDKNRRKDWSPVGLVWKLAGNLPNEKQHDQGALRQDNHPPDSQMGMQGFQNHKHETGCHSAYVCILRGRQGPRT